MLVLSGLPLFPSHFAEGEYKVNHEFLCCGIVGRVTLGQIELEAMETKEKVEKSILAEDCGKIRPSSLAESTLGNTPILGEEDGTFISVTVLQSAISIENIDYSNSTRPSEPITV